MEKNIKENDDGMGGTIEALVLDWYELQCYRCNSIRCQDDVSHVSPPSPDVILMADIVYYHQVVHHLVKTLLSLCSTDTLVMMSHEVRTTGDKREVVASFFNLMSQHFMEHLVPFDSLHPSHRSQDILIHLFKLKSNQLSN
jgi:predicted nicotinamide N-methyase